MDIIYILINLDICYVFIFFDVIIFGEGIFIFVLIFFFKVWIFIG